MSKSIEISPKYGVNPTIPVCFWCGKDKNEIALMGRVRERDPHTGRAVKGSDVEMPMHIVLNYEPCDCCKEQFNKGVQLIECNSRPVDERPALFKDDKGNPIYPTGRYVVLNPQAVQRIFDMKLEIGHHICIEEEVFSQLMQNVTMNPAITNN